MRWTDENGKKHTNTIATFESHLNGAAAMFDLLASRGYCGRPISKAIRKWCGNNWPAEYNKRISACGIDTATKLTHDLLLNQQFAITLAKAMAEHEAGKPYPLSDAEWAQAHEVAFTATDERPERKPMLAQKTTWNAAVPIAGGGGLVALEATSKASEHAVAISESIDKMNPYLILIALALIGAGAFAIWNRQRDGNKWGF